MAQGDFIRDPEQMMRFADSLELYIEDMRLACTIARRHVSDAESIMKDKIGKDAIGMLLQLIDDLEAGLPACDEIVRKLVHSASLGMEYESTRFRSR